MKAAAAERDITPPVGLEISHPVRANVGAHDPLFVRALVLQDGAGTTLAIVCSDLIGSDFASCDALRQRIADEIGIDNVLLNFSHPHSSRSFGDYASLAEQAPADAAWAAATRDAFLAVIVEAKSKLSPATLKAGRAPVQVGFNRRLVGDNGCVHMDDNPDGPVVPWTNTLEVDGPDGTPMAILFEHAAHPVIVPNGTALVSADFPGAAVVRIREALGPDVVPLFAQGCQGNINGYPLRSSHENADAAGRKLGDAVLAAMETAESISADAFRIRTGRADLPTRELPPWDEISESVEKLKAAFVPGENVCFRQEDHDHFVAHFEKLEQMMARGETPPPWRFDATVVSLGDEWVLVTYAGEMFCQYELWVDQAAPFAHNMTLGLTNGATGYIATDDSLAMGIRGGYEAGCLPYLDPCNVMTRHYGPPAVGCEKIIHDLVAGLWAGEQELPMNRRDDLVRRQTHGALAVCMLQKQRLGQRLAETRKLFNRSEKRRPLAVEIHSHSTYSDGCSTIAENVERVTKLSRMDFIFCTDHETLAQRRSVKRFRRAGLGEESVGGRYHVGLLCPSMVHKGRATVAEAVETARAVAPFVWVAHPVEPNESATFETIVADLATLGDLAIEVMNGFTRIARAYPGAGPWNVKLMDRLLAMGRRVTPLAGSDAHGLVEFGDCWTGVYAPRCSATSIASALATGDCFASELPLLDFACNGKPMGSTVRPRKGQPLRLTARAADAYGLAWARILSNGRVVKEWRIREDTTFHDALTRKTPARRTHYRLEIIAGDDRRAFSAPIYIEPR